MSVSTQVRCDGPECRFCWYGHDRITITTSLVEVRCTASDEDRERCGGGEKGHFDLPEPEMEFIARDKDD